jgi:O-antigen/teichoic acid export membrane protein
MDKSFVKNIGVIGGSTVLIQIVSFITVPIISRIYLPSELGEFSTIMSMAYIVLGIATLRMEQAIMLPDKISESIRIFHISVFIALVISFVTLLACWLLLDSIFVTQILPERPHLILFLPAIILSTKLKEISHLFLNKLTLYKVNSKVNILTSTINRASVIGLGYSFRSGGSIFLFISQLFSEALGFILKIRSIPVKIRFLIPIKVITKKHLALIKEYKSFPIFDVWSTLLNTLSSQLVPIILAFFTTSAVVGLYSQGLKLIQLPLIFFSSAIAQVFYQTISDRFKKNENISSFFEETLYFLFVIGLFPSLIVFVFGPELFTFFLGAKWVEAGEISQILMPWIFFQFLGSTLSSIFLVYNKQNLLLSYSAISFVSRFSVLIVLFYLFNVEYKLVLSVFSITGVLLYIYVLYLLFRIVSSSFYNFIFSIKKQFMLTMTFFLLLLLVKMFSNDFYVLLSMIFFISILYYSILLKFTDMGNKLKELLTS